MAIADTGSTGHYINSTTPQSKLSDSAQTLPIVTLPDNSTITASHASQLHLSPHLSQEATMAYSFPSIGTPLVSIGKICDDECVAVFTKHQCFILKDEHIDVSQIAHKSFLTGPRDPTTKLWNFNLHQPCTNQANTIYEMKKNQLIHFHHKALFSPTKHTWLQAIKNGFFTTWHGVNFKDINKHLQLTPATVKGHMRQQQQHYRSTKLYQHPDTNSIDMTAKLARTNAVYIRAVDSTGLLCTDQTGAFPVTSIYSNKYIMVGHHADTNAILVRPLPSRSQQHLKKAFQSIYEQLCTSNHAPTTVRLDNEAPSELKKYFKKQKLTFQLVPPNNHRRNYAEKAINVFKNHFISGLCSLPPKFPLHLWCRLLPHAEDSLNLLRQSNINPLLSSYAELNGTFDYDKTPMLPPGLEVIIHEKPSQRRSWDPRGVEGWYLGPAKNHYRCHRVFCTKTQSERVTDTINILPYGPSLPTVTIQEAAVMATEKLAESIHSSKKFGAQQLESIQQLTDALKTIINTKKQSPNLKTNHVPQSRVPHLLPPTPHSSLPSTSLTVPQTRVNSLPTMPNPSTSPPVPTHPYSLRKNRRPNPKYANGYANACLTISKNEMCNAVMDADSGKMLEFRHLIKKYPEIWSTSMANEFGRLMEGVGKRMPTGSKTMRFIPRTDIPSGKTVTYARIVCDYRPLKSEPNRTRLTVGGDRLTCHHDTSTDAADLMLIKLFLNSVLSTEKATFITADIKDFFLADNPLLSPEYMRIHIRFVPDEIINQYNLRPLVHNDWLYIEINKGMYGLKQAGYLANQNLKSHLASYGYRPCKHTRGLWRHDTRNIQFVLVVDDFGIKYVHDEDKTHLLNALRNRYKISVDETGANYCGLTLAWNYHSRSLDISMPNYIPNLLNHLKFESTHLEHSPHQHNIPVYGKKVQYANESPPLPLLSKNETTKIQQIVGSLLYYARAVDPTLLVALGTIAGDQNKPTETTAQAITQILNYVATHPLAVITYKASPMQLHIHSDASYLSVAKARSRAGGHFFLTNPTATQPNGPIHTVSNIMRNVMASAAESEIGAAFVNAQSSLPLRQALLDLGHRQPPTPIRTDNTTANGFLNETIKAKRTKAIDMRFYWLVDRIKQNQFTVYWKPGVMNLGDYHSKHHPPSHHQKMRPVIFNSAYLIKE